MTEFESFQHRVFNWGAECLGVELLTDTRERNQRFLEEALELVQACGCTESEAEQLVKYVFSRPVGEVHQEIGGVMVTLAALCNTQEYPMTNCAEIELSRVEGLIPEIKARQSKKPTILPIKN